MALPEFIPTADALSLVASYGGFFLMALWSSLVVVSLAMRSAEAAQRERFAQLMEELDQALPRHFR